MDLAVQRQPRWRLVVVAILLALGLTAAVAAAPEDSPLAPPTASASDNWDVKTGASCGLVGGSGSLVSEAFLDYSSSLASVRHDRLKLTNATSRNLEVLVQMWHNHVILTSFTVYLAPGQVSNYTFRHNNWYVHNDNGPLPIRGNPFLVVRGHTGSDDVVHNHWMNYFPSTSCRTPV